MMNRYSQGGMGQQPQGQMGRPGIGSMGMGMQNSPQMPGMGPSAPPGPPQVPGQGQPPGMQGEAPRWAGMGDGGPPPGSQMSIPAMQMQYKKQQQQQGQSNIQDLENRLMRARAMGANPMEIGQLELDLNRAREAYQLEGMQRMRKLQQGGMRTTVGKRSSTYMDPGAQYEIDLLGMLYGLGGNSFDKYGR